MTTGTSHDAQPRTGPSGTLISLNRLRGIAALCVVFGHAFNIAALAPARELVMPLFLLVASGTIYFVIIAGILFQMKAVPKLQAGRTRLSDLLRRRWSELSGIYLTIGLIMAIFVGLAQARALDVSPAYQILLLFLNGTMLYSYWYVPFFLLLMAATPVHLWFCRRSLPMQAALVIAGLVLSMLIHRPGPMDFWGVVHALCYYLPIFWLGLMIGAAWSTVLRILKGKEIWLLFAALAITGLQLQAGQTGVYLHTLGEGWGTLDYFILQKICLALCLISVLDRTRQMSMPVIDWIAQHSLTIFFMHAPVLMAIRLAPHLSGFYVPELVLATIFMIVFGVKCHAVFVRAFYALPRPIQDIAQAIRTARVAQPGHQAQARP